MQLIYVRAYSANGPLVPDILQARDCHFSSLPMNSIFKFCALQKMAGPSNGFQNRQLDYRRLLC